MKIEIACKKDSNTKDKGDLLEGLAKELLLAQNYEVIENLRITGAELDLICKHQVNNKEIYVECKAHDEKIGAPTLRLLNGTVDAYDYSEGWLLSISDFTKDAKGFIEMWKKKPLEKSSKLSFYSPENIIESLQTSGVICKFPKEKAEEFIGNQNLLGEYLLALTSYGRFWAIYTLNGGVPNGVLIFNAKDGSMVSDRETLTNLTNLDSAFSNYDLYIGLEGNKSNTTSHTELPKVVEVQTGDSWKDYRPARPQDFIGRENLQKEILEFLKQINENKTNTRIFAITGNSGLGKSSLVAKVRDRSRNQHYKKKYFTFAVDIRGAKSPNYISAALLRCLNKAQEANFGDQIDLKLTDPSSPLSSESIDLYLKSVAQKNQVICLVFDQFEELYSKPELFSVFSAAKDLMLEVVSYQGNLSLGFAWKTDSTTQQDHPAYHMWHELSDYRKVYKLNVFDKGEITKAITTFEKEIDQKIPIEIRNQISYSSQGFPWLLKKLCINLSTNLKKGSNTFIAELDVKKLFESDLEILNTAERACLDLIAQKAPADWSEIIETSGITVLNNLVTKRLVIKSGDRLNIYWDIFKDYLLTGNTPIIPFNFIPTTDIHSILKVSKVLEKKFLKSSTIAERTKLKEKTIWNVGADLVMLGIAERDGVNFKCHQKLDSNKDESILQKLREKLEKHTLKLILYKKFAGKLINKEEIEAALRFSLTTANFSDKTWAVYTNRLTRLLVSTGYLIRNNNQFIVQDTGSVTILKGASKRKSLLFMPMSSPANICEALKLIKERKHKLNWFNTNGYRNSLSVLTRLGLVVVRKNKIEAKVNSIKKYGGFKEAIWSIAKNEPVIVNCIKRIEEEPRISGPKLGEYVSGLYNKEWTEASQKRNGNSLKQWTLWIQEGIQTSSIPLPPGRIK